MLCKWRDKRDICICATNDSGDDTVRATRRHRQIVNLSVPSVSDATTATWQEWIGSTRSDACLLWCWASCYWASSTSVSSTHTFCFDMMLLAVELLQTEVIWTNKKN